GAFPNPPRSLTYCSFEFLGGSNTSACSDDDSERSVRRSEGNCFVDAIADVCCTPRRQRTDPGFHRGSVRFPGHLCRFSWGTWSFYGVGFLERSAVLRAQIRFHVSILFRKKLFSLS